MRILILKKFKNKILHILFLILIFSSSNISFANFNSFQYFIGDKASGMGGAFTAQADDPNALWYNPAGLALIKSSQISISANTYNFLKQKREDVVEVEFPDQSGESMDIKEKDFSIIPTSLAYSFKLSENSSLNPVLGVGIFVPAANSLQASLDESASNNLQRMDIYSVYKRENRQYIFSTGVGINLLKYLNLGISAGIGYFSQNVSQEWRQYFSDSALGYNSFYSKYVNEESTSVTATATAGIQSKVGNNFFGIAYKFPHYKIYNDSKTEIFIDAGSSDNTLNQHRRTTVEPELYKNIPASLSAGYAYKYPDLFTLSLEVSRYFKKEDLEKNINNYHAGIEFYITDTFILRSGFFTDKSQEKDLNEESIRSERLDYYGATLALSFLSEMDNKKFWSSFGLTYRQGRGEYRSTKFTTSGIQFENKEWTTHNFALYFSESIVF